MKRPNFGILILAIAITSLLSFAISASPAEPKKCTSNKDCSGEEFCDTTPKCQDGKNPGVCIVKPQFCTMEYIPVKGCDGKVYSNRCHAQAEGQPTTGLAEPEK